MVMGWLLIARSAGGSGGGDGCGGLLCGGVALLAVAGPRERLVWWLGGWSLPVPVRVTVVPPAADPELGLTEVRAGAGT